MASRNVLKTLAVAGGSVKLKKGDFLEENVA
jgi:hypothetical protein